MAADGLHVDLVPPPELPADFGRVEVHLGGGGADGRLELVGGDVEVGWLPAIIGPVESDHGVVVHSGPLLHFGHLGERQAQQAAQLPGGDADLGGQGAAQGDGEAPPATRSVVALSR